VNITTYTLRWRWRRCLKPPQRLWHSRGPHSHF